MSAFQTLAETVMRRTRLNTDWFAETVTYRTALGDEHSVPAHVRHEIRLKVDPDTNDETVIEQINVELDRAEITEAPTYGDRILLAGEDQAYLYTWSGKHRWTSWHATFERQRQTAAGV